MSNRNSAAPSANNEPVLGPALEATIAAVQNAEFEHKRVEEAVRIARDQRATAEQELADVRTRLAQSEAEAAVNGCDVDRVGRRRLATLREQIELIDARLAGLGTWRAPPSDGAPVQAA